MQDLLLNVNIVSLTAKLGLSSHISGVEIVLDNQSPHFKHGDADRF